MQKMFPAVAESFAKIQCNLVVTNDSRNFFPELQKVFREEPIRNLTKQLVSMFTETFLGKKAILMPINFSKMFLLI